MRGFSADSKRDIPQNFSFSFFFFWKQSIDQRFSNGRNRRKKQCKKHQVYMRACLHVPKWCVRKCAGKKIIATDQHISHSDEHVHVFFLQGITYNQVVTVCPQLVGRVLHWQRFGGPVSFCCLAGEQVLVTRTFKVYSSLDDLEQAVAQGQGRVPMTSITLALAPNSPTLQAVFFNASQDKENFSFSKLFEAKNISSKDVEKPTAARRPPLSSLNASSAAKQQSTQPQESKTAVQPKT